MYKSSSILARFKAEATGRFLALLASGISTVLLARLLEPGEYGLLNLAISLIGIITVLGKLGFPKSAGRYISEYKAKDPDQIPYIVSITSYYVLIATLIAGFLLALSSSFIAKVLGEPDLFHFLLIGIFYLVFLVFLRFIRNVLQGYELIREAAFVSVLNGGGTLFFAVGLVLLSYGAIGAMVGYTLGSAIATVVGAIFVNKHVFKKSHDGIAIETGLRRRITEYAIPLTVTDTTTILDRHIDSVLVGFFLTPVAVGYYTVAKHIVTFVKAPANALGFTLSPTLSQRRAAGNPSEAARIFETALVNNLILYIPAGVGLLLVADPTIRIVFGREYLPAVPILQVFSIYAIALSISAITSNGLDYLGRARGRAIIRGGATVINIALNIVLIPQMGAIGAAYATTATFSLYTLSTLHIIHNELGLQIREIANRIVQILLVTACMAGVVLVVRDSFEGIISLMMSVTLGFLTWITLVSFVGLVNLNDVRNMIR